MQKGAKHFAEKLNKCLDEIEAPPFSRERAAILSKLLDIPKQQAWGFIEGQQTPDPSLLERIAEEFDVKPDWLTGK